MLLELSKTCTLMLQPRLLLPMLQLQAMELVRVRQSKALIRFGSMTRGVGKPLDLLSANGKICVSSMKCLSLVQMGQHRLQLGPNRGGIVLLTKSFLSEASKQVGKQDLAVLPVTDNMHLPHLAAKLEGPYEVAMYDEAAKLSY